jgi:hypothetical protein
LSFEQLNSSTMPRAAQKKSLFAKNDSRLCQIVWRKLHRNLIARHNPDEMLTHFPRDMGKDIALARKIDTKHCARKDLSHSAFGDDLLFLRHRVANIRVDAIGSRVRGFQESARTSCVGNRALAIANFSAVVLRMS